MANTDTPSCVGVGIRGVTLDDFEVWASPNLVRSVGESMFVVLTLLPGFDMLTTNICIGSSKARLKNKLLQREH